MSLGGGVVAKRDDSRVLVFLAVGALVVCSGLLTLDRRDREPAAPPSGCIAGGLSGSGQGAARPRSPETTTTDRPSRPAPDDGAAPDRVPYPMVRGGDPPILLGATEVSRALWADALGSPPRVDCGRAPVHLDDPQHPATCVSWLEALELANALSERDGLRAAYDLADDPPTWDPAADGYRLPTEAEWIAAAPPERPCIDNRLDTQGVAALGRASDEGFLCDDGQAGPARVSSAPKGLQAMHGNVAEWTWDAWAEADPRRVQRGGSWRTGPAAAPRRATAPSARTPALGVRLARNATPER